MLGCLWITFEVLPNQDSRKLDIGNPVEVSRPMASGCAGAVTPQSAERRLLAHVDSQAHASGRILPLDRYQQRECYKSTSLQHRSLKLLLTRIDKLSQIILRNQAKKAYRPARAFALPWWQL